MDIGMSARKYDVVVWGATGFTGRLITRYMCLTYPESSGVRWAIAGRNETKLMEVRLDTGRKCNRSVAFIDIIAASLEDASSLDRLASSTHVILSSAGPFARVGSPVVEACLRCDTNYVDITGEVQWVRQVIDKHHEAAAKKKIKIVPTCGFDCIPSDIGCYFMVKSLKERNLQPAEVRLLLEDTKGSFSGGTAASMLNVFASSSMSDLIGMLNPFYLNPKDQNSGLTIQPTSKKVTSAAADSNFPEYDSKFKTWTMPFIMQTVNCRVVNRSNAIAKWSYGENFIYSEKMQVSNIIFAIFGSIIIPIIGLFMIIPFTRKYLERLVPAPGQGPSKEELESGYFKVKFWATGKDSSSGTIENITGGIRAMNGDPGYFQTSKMVSECAVCLAQQAKQGFKSSDVFGVITPSVAFGEEILPRLNDIDINFYCDK